MLIPGPRHSSSGGVRGVLSSLGPVCGFCGQPSRNSPNCVYIPHLSPELQLQRATLAHVTSVWLSHRFPSVFKGKGTSLPLHLLCLPELLYQGTWRRLLSSCLCRKPGCFPWLLPLPPPLPTFTLRLVVLVPEASLCTSQHLPSFTILDPDHCTVVTAPVHSSRPDPSPGSPQPEQPVNTCECGRASMCLHPPTTAPRGPLSVLLDPLCFSVTACL